MIKAKKVSSDKFEFKNTIIFRFIMLGIAGVVCGYFLITVGLEGNWQQINEDTIPIVIGVLAAGGGIISLIFGPQIHTFVFDKGSNKIFYTKKKLTGTDEDSYTLGDVKNIIITQSRKKSSSDNKKKIVYKYNLQFNDEDLIQLAEKVKKSSSFSRIKGSKIPDEVKQLSQFLDIEIESKSFKESFGEVVNTVSKMMSSAKEEKEKTEETSA